MTNPSSGVDPKSFTPTQDLILNVLAARFRLGENLWTFDSTLRKQADQLAARGLVFTTHGIIEHTIRVGLTEVGKAATLSPDYSPPEPTKHITQEQLRHGLEYATFWAAEGSANSRPYWDGVRDTLRVVTGMTTEINQASCDDAAVMILLSGR